VRLQRFFRSLRTVWFSAFVCLTSMALGCGLLVQPDLSQVLGEIFGTEQFSDPNATVIRIINQTNADELVTLNIDGQDISYACSAETQICDFPLDTCPTRIEAVSERRTDSSTGAFQGGRDFNGSDPEFILESNEFQCGNVIIFRFTITEVEVMVL